MVVNFIQDSWNWISGFRSLVGYKAEYMSVSNAPSWAVLTIIIMQSKSTADFLVTVIPTGIVLVLRNLFTFFSTKPLIFAASIFTCIFHFPQDHTSIPLKLL